MSEILKDLVIERLKGDVEIIIKKASPQNETASRIYLPVQYAGQEVIMILTKKEK